MKISVRRINQDPAHRPFSIVHDLCIDMIEHCERAQDPGEKKQNLNIFLEKAVIRLYKLSRDHDKL